MRSTSAMKRREAESHDHMAIQDYGPKADMFAQELTELCQQHRIGIAGNPELFVMDAQDRHLRYSVDGDGKLVLG